MMAAALALSGNTNRELYLFDTFDGLPPPGDLDVDFNGVSAAEQMANDPSRVGPITAVAHLDEVRQNMASTGYPDSQVHYIEGMVEDTIQNWRQTKSPCSGSTRTGTNRRVMSYCICFPEWSPVASSSSTITATGKALAKLSMTTLTQPASDFSSAVLISLVESQSFPKPIWVLRRHARSSKFTRHLRAPLTNVDIVANMQCVFRQKVCYQ